MSIFKRFFDWMDYNNAPELPKEDIPQEDITRLEIAGYAENAIPSMQVESDMARAERLILSDNPQIAAAAKALKERLVRVKEKEAQDAIKRLAQQAELKDYLLSKEPIQVGTPIASELNPDSPTWRFITEYCEDQLDKLRKENDSIKRTDMETSFLRGRIEQLKRIRDLNKPKPGRE